MLRNGSSSNATDTSGPSKLHVDSWFIFSIIFSIFGSLLLILLLLSTLFNDTLRHGSRFLITNLMLMQLLVCAVFFPILNVSTYLSMHRIKIHINCHLTLLGHIGTMHAENWASVFLAVNRYVAIVLPHHYHKLMSKTVIVMSAVLPWLIGITDTLPVYFGHAGGFAAERPYGNCFIAYSMKDGNYGTVWAAIGAYVPITLTGIVYLTLFAQIAVARQKAASGRVLGPLVATTFVLKARTKRARNIAMANMLVASFLIYAICYLPGPVILTEYPYLFTNANMLFLWTGRTLVLVGYALSPVLFLVLSSDYQVAVAHVVKNISCFHPLPTNRHSSTRENSYSLRALPPSSPTA